MDSMEQLAGDLGVEEWLALAHKLEVPHPRIQAIKSNNRGKPIRNCTYQILGYWAKTSRRSLDKVNDGHVSSL